MINQRMRQQAGMKLVRKNGGQERRSLRLLAVLVLIVLLVIVVRSRVFVIREIVINGNVQQNPSVIAGQTGLRLGMSIFSVKENEVERNLLANPYVELLEVNTELPDTVVLEIRERTACAAINCAGVILLTDGEGYILERLANMPQDTGIIVVSGMDVSIGAQGYSVESGVAGQKDVMKMLLEALDASQMTDVVSELNIADMDNLYMVSCSGIQILLGDETMISDKIIWAKAVLEKLTAEGCMSGILDVSSGKNAVYADR